MKYGWNIILDFDLSKDYIPYRPAQVRASSRGVKMMEPGAAPAGGGQRIPPLPGRAGPRPGTLGCPARSSLTVGVQLKPSPKARTGPRKTPRWSAERRPHPSKEDAARRIRTRLIGAPSPRFIRGGRKAPQSGAGVTAYPGPVKNAGDNACLRHCPAPIGNA